LRPYHARIKIETNAGAVDRRRSGHVHRLCVTGQRKPKEIAACIVVQEFRRQPEFGIKLSKIGATVEQQFVTGGKYPKLQDNCPSERNDFCVARYRRDVHAARTSDRPEQIRNWPLEQQDFQKTQHIDRRAFLVEFGCT
jgi:hypothetical protein